MRGALESAPYGGDDGVKVCGISLVVGELEGCGWEEWWRGGEEEIWGNMKGKRFVLPPRLASVGWRSRRCVKNNWMAWTSANTWDYRNYICRL